MTDAAFAALLETEPSELVLPVDHLSASSLTKYGECRESWRRKYIAKEREPYGVAMLWGTADSVAAAHNYQQKVESFEQLPVDEIKDVFRDSVVKEVDDAGGASEIKWDDSTPSVDQLKDRGVALAEAYHTTVAPNVQPIASEQRIEVAVPGVAVPIIGYLDVETEGVVIERKTAKAKFANGTPAGNYRLQAQIYQLARPKPVHWHVSTKTKQPAIYTPENEFTPEGLPGLELGYSRARNEATERLVRVLALSIMSDLNTFGPDGPWPGSRAQYLSPCGRCGFKRTCAWWTA